MSNNQNSSGKDFLVGAIVGGLVGAAAALFLSPKTGSDIRRELAKQATVVKEKTSELSKDAYQKGIVLVDYAKNHSSTVTHTLSEQSSQLVERVKTGSTQLKELVKNATDSNQNEDKSQATDLIESIEASDRENEVIRVSETNRNV